MMRRRILLIARVEPMHVELMTEMYRMFYS